MSWRAVWYVPAALLWTALVLSCALVAVFSTLLRFREPLLAFFGPLWGRGLLWIIGCRVRVVGREFLASSDARVVVANHSSFLDMVSVAVLCPPAVLGVGKKEFLWVPFIGWTLWAFGMPLVDRKDRASAVAAMKRIALDLRRHPRSVFIFPEGTRSRTGELLPFKLGAFHLAVDAGVPLVPVVIHGAHAMLPPDTLKVTPGELVIEVKPPLSTEGWQESDLRGRADTLRAAYAQWLLDGPPARP